MRPWETEWRVLSGRGREREPLLVPGFHRQCHSLHTRHLTLGVHAGSMKHWAGSYTHAGLVQRRVQSTGQAGPDSHCLRDSPAGSWQADSVGPLDVAHHIHLLAQWRNGGRKSHEQRVITVTAKLHAPSSRGASASTKELASFERTCSSTRAWQSCHRTQVKQGPQQATGLTAVSAPPPRQPLLCRFLFQLGSGFRNLLIFLSPVSPKHAALPHAAQPTKPGDKEVPRAWAPLLSPPPDACQPNVLILQGTRDTGHIHTCSSGARGPTMFWIQVLGVAMPAFRCLQLNGSKPRALEHKAQQPSQVTEPCPPTCHSSPYRGLSYFPQQQDTLHIVLL